MKLLNPILLSICGLLTGIVNAQNYQWLKTYGSDAVSSNFSIVSIISLRNGDCISLAHYSRINPNTPDTLTFDTFSSILLPGEFGSSYLITSDSNGNVINLASVGEVTARSMCSDDSGFLYISFDIDHSNPILIGNDTLVNSEGNIGFAKFRDDLTCMWVSQAANQTSYRGKLDFSNGKLFFSLIANYPVQIGNKSYNTGLRTNFFGQINRSNGTIEWSNYLIPYLNSNDIFHISGLVSVDSNIFLSTSLSNNTNSISSNYTLANDTLPYGINIIQTDNTGNYKRKFSAGNNYNNIANFITTDGHNIYVGGKYKDTLNWGNLQIIPEYPGGSGLYEIFLASLDSNLNARWFYRPEVLNKSTASGELNCGIFINNFLYTGGVITTQLKFDNKIISPGNYKDAVFIKFDAMGNPLWASNGGSRESKLNTIHALPGRNVFCGGEFKDSIKFGSFNSTASLNTAHGWLVKLSDNAIIRGEVSKGPYCAGDTFSVPYVKIGDYDTSNFFIAELSDEHGLFEGGQRELGRIKTNRDSVVKGVLPLFQVASSEKYRIRIRSTAPAVQSYYKVDTLRLLIYSKDKANPGGDTVICKGDSLVLQTYGGTRWTWSPKYNMADSSARTTPAWPAVTTTYQIIIADSSGCGQADTATKTVFVRKALSVQFHTPKDTSVCIGGTMPLMVSFHGGDSSGYSFQWAAVDALGNFSFPKSGSGKNGDTLLYSMPPGEKDSMRLILYLSDGCTPNTAFATYTLKVSKSPARGAFSSDDTALCPGSSMPVAVQFSGAPADKLSWIWQEQNQANQWINRKSGSNKQADTFNYSLPLSWKGIKRLRVVLSDQCSGLKDTAIYNITPRDTLMLTLNAGDTTLCKGQSFTWKASGADGYPEGYQFLWTDIMTGDTLSFSDSLSISASGNQNIRVSLTDGCMPKSISKTFLVTVHPDMTADILVDGSKAGDTALCYGQSIVYIASASGGKGSGYSYKWMLDSIVLSTSDRLQADINTYRSFAGSKTRLQLITGDACTLPDDSAEITIDILARLAQSVQHPDTICHGSTALFRSNASGGKGSYTHRWMDESNNLISSSDTFLFVHNGPQSGIILFRSVLSDGCSLNDTTALQSVLLDPLNLSLSASDSCPVNTLTLTASAVGGKTSSHLIRWFEGSSLIGTGSSIQTNTGGQPGIYTAILSDACSEPSDTGRISSGARPGIQINASGICLGDETGLLAAATNAARAMSYRWTIDGVPQTEQDSLILKTFTSAGYYPVKVTAIGGNCDGSDSLVLEILQKPVAAFDYVHFNSRLPIPFQFNNRSLFSQTWFWDFGSGDTSMQRDPLYLFSDTGRFAVTLIASNQGKCFDTAAQIIPVYPSIEFYFPNVFSPDGNGINESFGLHQEQWFMVKEYNLKIFNRWGEMVFSSDQVQQHWDGQKAQQGIYIWKAEVRDVYNVLHEMKGVVEVLR